MRQNVEFKVLFIAEGSSCRFSDPNCFDALKSIKTRTNYALKSLSLLGISKFCFCNLPCGRLDQVPIIEINKLIETHINSFNPDTIFTHSGIDANNDHRVIHRATLMATRPRVGSPIRRVLAFEILSSSEWSFGEAFHPTWFEEISDEDLMLKFSCLSAYESEVKSYPFPRSEEGLRVLAMRRGMQSGFHLAEAFMLIREFRP